MIIYPYKSDSESAKELAAAIGCRRMAHNNSKFKPSPDKTILNWGASKMPKELLQCKIINHPDAVAIASNKLSFFNAMAPDPDAGRVLIGKVGSKQTHVLYHDHGYVRGLAVGDLCNGDNSWKILSIKPLKDSPRTPQFTDHKGLARDWVLGRNVVMARTVLNGNSGEGIVLIKHFDEMVDAPLYVMYVPKKQEYRIHVLHGEVVDVQRKARRKDVPDDKVNWMVRNHDNGFIFAREDGLGDVPDDVTEQAVKAVKCCGLDFGAVDVIFSEKQQQAYVLEVNTAPGLSGQTLEGYAKRFRGVK